MKREVPVEQAIGLALAHDLTQIIPKSFKGVAFRKGHVIAAQDVPKLLDMGKRHVYVLEIGDDELHEDEAAVRMASAVAGCGVTATQPHEGKVILKAAHDGMLYIDAERVYQMNLVDEISITTRQPFIRVRPEQSVAGIRPIPLTIQRNQVARVEHIAHSETRATVDVWPFQDHRVAIVTTGSEVLTGRVSDKFGPVLREKFRDFGIEVASQAIVGDEVGDIVAATLVAIAEGATIVCLTGGMSVDPDDRTPAAIHTVADEVVSHGTPMLPGSMMMVAYQGATTLFGLPGAVIHDDVTAFDILLPRVLAGWRLTKADIARHGVGGWLNG